jgi:hypothetical protein
MLGTVVRRPPQLFYLHKPIYFRISDLSIGVELFLALQAKGDMGSEFRKTFDLAARRIGLHTRTT